MAFIQKPTARLTQAYQKFSRKRKMFAELSALSDRELADIGLYRGDIGRVVRDSAY
ncbi:MAG: DUF1127 domain-containing protein [Pseudomonadota bacterium]